MSERRTSDRSALPAPRPSTQDAPPSDQPGERDLTPTSASPQSSDLLDDARQARDAGDFERALTLVEEMRQRKPDGPLAPERELLRIRLFVDLNEISLARAHSKNFLIDFPDHPLAPEVMRLTGVHRPPERGASRIPERLLRRER